MNTEAYISSGILESYLLGELSEAESREVEARAARDPKIRQVLEEMELLQEKLMKLNAVEPSAKLRQKVLQSLDRKIAVNNEQETWILGSASVPRIAIAASVSIVLVSSALAIGYFYKWKSTETTLISLKEESARLAESVKSVNQKLERSQNEFTIAVGKDFKRVTLSGTPNSPGSFASVYWNDQTSAVFLNVTGLQSLSADKQYQLWAIIDGKPVDAGVVEGSGEGLLQMKLVAGNVSAFAITVEQRGGSAVPSLETMQVVGSV